MDEKTPIRMYRIDFINADKGYCYESIVQTTDKSKKQFFRYLQQEYGRCTSKVYQETTDKKDKPIGWTFEKRVPYDNRGYEPITMYTREVLVYEI